MSDEKDIKDTKVTTGEEKAEVKSVTHEDEESENPQSGVVFIGEEPAEVVPAVVLSEDEKTQVEYKEINAQRDKLKKKEEKRRLVFLAHAVDLFKKNQQGAEIKRLEEQAGRSADEKLLQCEIKFLNSIAAIFSASDEKKATNVDLRRLDHSFTFPHPNRATYVERKVQSNPQNLFPVENLNNFILACNTRLALIEGNRDIKLHDDELADAHAKSFLADAEGYLISYQTAAQRKREALDELNKRYQEIIKIEKEIISREVKAQKYTYQEIETLDERLANIQAAVEEFFPQNWFSEQENLQEIYQQNFFSEQEIEKGQRLLAMIKRLKDKTAKQKATFTEEEKRSSHLQPILEVDEKAEVKVKEDKAEVKEVKIDQKIAPNPPRLSDKKNEEDSTIVKPAFPSPSMNKTSWVLLILMFIGICAFITASVFFPPFGVGLAASVSFGSTIATVCSAIATTISLAFLCIKKWASEWLDTLKAKWQIFCSNNPWVVPLLKIFTGIGVVLGALSCLFGLGLLMNFIPKATDSFIGIISANASDAVTSSLSMVSNLELAAFAVSTTIIGYTTFKYSRSGYAAAGRPLVDVVAPELSLEDTQEIHFSRIPKTPAFSPSPTRKNFEHLDPSEVKVENVEVKKECKVAAS